MSGQGKFVGWRSYDLFGFRMRDEVNGWLVSTAGEMSVDGGKTIETLGAGYIDPNSGEYVPGRTYETMMFSTRAEGNVRFREADVLFAYSREQAEANHQEMLDRARVRDSDRWLEEQMAEDMDRYADAIVAERWGFLMARKAGAL